MMNRTLAAGFSDAVRKFGGRIMRPIWLWLENQFIQEIPADLALCEYECRKQDCTEADWLICERRITHAEAAEPVRIGRLRQQQAVD